MTWTEAQNEAIHKRGSNIIVSAGAGSGKTAVLSERILEFCKNGGDIRRVLVLTFTEAAALEMKERIRKKLSDNHLDEASMNIDSSYITTFDSYSLSMVKKYFYRLGLSSDISIMDGAFIRIKKNEIIRNLFTEYYLNHNERFLSFMDKYSLQNDNQVLDMVSQMTDRLDLIVDLKSFYETYEETYFSSSKMDEILEEYEDFARCEVSKFTNSLRNLLNECTSDDASRKLEEFLSEFLSHFSPLASYSDLYEILNGFSFPRLSPKAKESVKEKKNDAAALLKDLKDKVFCGYASLDEMKEEILSTKEDVLFLLSVCKEVQKRLMEYKMGLGMYGFNDIAKFAIRLVSEFQDVRAEIKSSYDEILVDEYQDTSDIQEAFLSLIENNNRYMVGDIKQSIYRFRNANPYIFKAKYDSYGRNEGGIKIDLTFNFRSRREVLSNINLLFDTLMTESRGDANYRRDHEMTYGQKDYITMEMNPTTRDNDFNMQILSYEKDMESLFTQAETEAFIIGYDIKRRMETDIEALHKKYEKISYNDFAILISTAGEFLTFKKVFEYMNIPLSIEASMDLKESVLPVLYSNVLLAMSKEMKNLHDREYYHAITSLARSFLYGYSDEDIYQMTALRKDYPVMEDIRNLSKYKEISYSALFHKISSYLHVYDKLSLIGDVDSSLAILEHIHDNFKLFDSVGYGVDEASEYLNELLSSGIKMEYKPTSSIKNAVRIMTIHKSKGLEFPYVYFPLLDKGFNQADMRVTVGLSSKYGLFIPFADTGKSSTIIRTLYQKDTEDADISEKIRLFYVALTRAREEMIFILPKREEKKTDSDYKSFADMLYAVDGLTPYTKNISLDDYPAEDYNTKKKAVHDFKGTKMFLYEEEKLPSLQVHEHISKEIYKVPDASTLYAMNLGTYYHEALETLDFRNPDVESLPVSFEMKEKLEILISNPVFARMKNAQIYQEHEFYMNLDGADYHGIIDLMAIYSDHVDIVDYKLSDTSSPEYDRQLGIYKEYAKKVTGKPVSLYLLSIMKNEIRKIEN